MGKSRKKSYSAQEIRANLDIPKSLKVGMVAKRILEPIQKELSPHCTARIPTLLDTDFPCALLNFRLLFHERSLQRLFLLFT